MLNAECCILELGYWERDPMLELAVWEEARSEAAATPCSNCIHVCTYIHTCPLSWHFYGIRRQTDFTSSGKRKRPVGLHCIVDRVGWSLVGANSNQLPSGDDFLNDGCSYSYPEWIECYLQASNCHSSITIIFQNCIF